MTREVVELSRIAEALEELESSTHVCASRIARELERQTTVLERLLERVLDTTER